MTVPPEHAVGGNRRGLIAAVLLCVAGAAALGSRETMLGLAAAGGVGAILATRGRARRAAGAGMAAFGLATLWSGLPLVAAGVLTITRGPGWPALGRRYERAARDDDPWSALDRGEDPTDSIPA